VEAVLEVENLQAGYGSVPVLFDVSLRVEAGSLVTLLGRNGMGKTTTVRAIMGQIGRTAKRMTFHGVSIVASTSDQVARAGVGLVPEGRRIFRTLSVYENLIATAADRRKAEAPWTLERVYNLFPRMRERAGQYAGTLSGGEQQMLAIGRALMTNPELLILDEATEGLAPLIREEIWQALEYLKNRGQSILVIDKDVRRLMPLADRHYMIEKGRTVWNGTSLELSNDAGLGDRFLGLGGEALSG
jgi:branched-chain amino acid transport system ATP-binding protein